MSPPAALPGPGSGARLRSPLAIAAVSALLLVLLGLAWWGYASFKKRELQSALIVLATDASSRVGDALQARPSGAADLERLDGDLKALTAATRRLAGLDTWRSPLLSEAAEQYLDEAQALLRRLIALRRADDTVRADIDALAEHLRAARGRSSEWISEAVARKQRMERDFFDYRLAEGGLQKSLRAMPEARRDLAPLIPAVPLLNDGPFEGARIRLAETSARLSQQVEDARKLPLPR